MTEEQKKKKAEYMRKWAQENKDRLKEYYKKRSKTPEFKEYRKKYYEEHKEKIYASQTKYRHKNSKAISEMVYACKKRKADLLKEQGIYNAWEVINYNKEPRYEPGKRGRKPKNVKA